MNATAVVILLMKENEDKNTHTYTHTHKQASCDGKLTFSVGRLSFVENNIYYFKPFVNSFLHFCIAVEFVLKLILVSVLRHIPDVLARFGVKCSPYKNLNEQNFETFFASPFSLCHKMLMYLFFNRSFEPFSNSITPLSDKILKFFILPHQ